MTNGMASSKLQWLKLFETGFSERETIPQMEKTAETTTTTAQEIIANLDKLKSSAFLVSQWQIFIPYLKEYLTVLCTSSKAGCISNNFSAWTGITWDKEILSDIRGMAVELSELPVQHHFVPTKFNSAETAIIQQEINKMIKKGIIEKVSHEKHEIISNIFHYQRKMALMESFLI